MTKILRLAGGLVAGKTARHKLLSDLAAPAIIHRGRARTCDIAYTYRMPAGFSGDVNRTHPFWIEPCAIDQTSPPTFYGQACVLDATTHKIRSVLDGDHDLTDIYGIAVRPFPFQQATATNYGAATIGDATPPLNQPIDILRSGYCMVKIAGTPVKGGDVYVWADAAASANVPGIFTVTTTAGSTIGPLTTQINSFQGGVDSGSVGEVAIHV